MSLQPTETLAIEGRDATTARPVRLEIASSMIRSVDLIPDRDDLPWLAPGLVDLQVNGYAGLDLNDSGLDVATVVELTRVLRDLGVTTYVPTLITASRAQLSRALAVIAEARRRASVVAHAVPCVHLEGPYISKEDGPRGAHPLEHIRAPDEAEVDEWIAASEGLLGRMTLSPHHDNAPAVIRGLLRRGIEVAIGHTHATAEQVHAAADAGARMSTHLGNGCHATLPRHPNHLWAQLADGRLHLGLIADGHHLDADTFRSMLRAAGPARIHLVSDSAALAGSAPGIYPTPVGGEVEVTDDGALRKPGTPFLAGAARALPADIRVAMDLAGLTLAESLRLATANPARLLPASAGVRGRLTGGAVADIIILAGEDRVAVADIVLCGRYVRA